MCSEVDWLCRDVRMSEAKLTCKDEQCNTKGRTQTEQVCSIDPDKWIKLRCDGKIRRPSSMGKWK